MARKLCTIRLAPTSSAKHSATCATTRPACRRWPPRVRATAPRAPSFRSLTRFGRTVRNAGSRPTMSVVKIAMPIEKSTTRPSMVKSSQYGSEPAGNARIIASTIHCDISNPMPAPGTAMRTVSASVAHSKRPRPAPIAARTASSRCRDAPRTSIKLARFAHMISSTNPTADIRTMPMRSIVGADVGVAGSERRARHSRDWSRDTVSSSRLAMPISLRARSLDRLTRPQQRDGVDVACRSRRLIPPQRRVELIELRESGIRAATRQRQRGRDR